MQTLLADISPSTFAFSVNEKLDFLMNLVLFAMDESSDLGLDNVSCLLDQASLLIEAHRSFEATSPLRQCA